MKCSQCVAEYLAYEAGINGDGGEIPEILDPITLAASWQQNNIMGQMVIACVSLPTCLKHLQVSKMSAEQKAILGGKLLPARQQVG